MKALMLALLLVSSTASADKALADIRFARGSARLPDAAGSQLARVARWADENFNGLVVVDGHPDAGGTAKLSLRRARIVRDQLLALGVDPSQIVISAFGPEDPQHARVTVWGSNDSLDKVLAERRRAQAVRYSRKPVPIHRRVR
jgi:outer membrane protein OmpA-like peptidoglycan-associated protein